MKEIQKEMILKAAESMYPQLINWRRDFHKYAEPGWMEMRTASLIARALTDMGYDPKLGKTILDADSRMGLPDRDTLQNHYVWALENGGDRDFLPEVKDGYTGVIAELDCGPGPVIALRFDIDALGVTESSMAGHRPYDEGWDSVTEGVMHSCGHDGHAAIGLGTARLLMEHSDQLKGRIRLIFQPAEEGVRGAKSIVAAGWLDDVDYVLAAHVIPRGSSDADVALIQGGGNFGLGTVKYDITYTGQAAHAGVNPQEGNNALLAAATAVLNIHSIPRYGKVPTMVNVGKLNAGTGRNVVCDRAQMEMEIRGETEEAVSFMEERAVSVAKAAAQMHNCQMDIRCMGAAPSMICSPELTDLVAEVCRDELGLVLYIGEPHGGGSEDFAYFTRRVEARGGQSLFMALPCDCKASNHDPCFDFDERVLVNGVKAFAGAVFGIIQEL